MSNMDRELRKQLLLIKGEALRTQLTLEIGQWRKPSHLLQQGISLLGGGSLFSSAMLLLRQGKPRRWLRWLLAGFGLLRLLRR